MAKHKLSISLIKEGYTEQTALNEQNTRHVTLLNGQHLYYKSNQAVEAKWLSFFEDGIEEQDKRYFKSKNTSAVVFYNVNVGNNTSRLFAITFGHGKNLLASNALERRFRLLVTLNSIKVDSIRSVDFNTMEANPLKNRLQASILSPIGNFNIDANKDLLKSVTGKSVIEHEGELLEGTVSGSDSLSLSTDRLYNNIDDLLQSCYERYRSQSYKENFDWIDNIQPIKDRTIIDNLDNKLINNLNLDNPENIWISIPDIIDYQDISYFSLKSDAHYDDLDVNIVKNEYRRTFDMGNIRTLRVRCCGSDDSCIANWSLYRCLYTEVIEDGKQFILNDGKWFQVDQNFVDQVNSEYERATLSTIALPEIRNEEYENKYNDRACSTHADEYFLMDCKDILYGGSKIEFCDIFTKSNQFIHVKKYNGSAVLSHLFAQGLVSAESFFDKEYRHKANLILGDSFKVDETGSINQSDYEIIYAIAKAGIEHGSKPSIPFFSKVSFRIAKTRLEKFGYKVSIFGIGKEQ